MTFYLVLLFVLLVLSAFFSSSETAFLSLERVQLEHYVREHRADAARVSAMLDRPGRLLSAILLGNNLVNTGAAAVGTVIAAELVSQGQAALAATVVITILLVIFGEIGPKTIALHHNWALTRAYAGPLLFWARAMRPVVALISSSKSASATTRLIRPRLSASSDSRIRPSRISSNISCRPAAASTVSISA